MKLACVVLILLFPAAARAADTAARPALKDFLGVCGHTVQFKPELYAPVCSLVRDYHPVEWDLGKGTATLPKWPEAKNRVNWETIYGGWQKRGFRTDACLMVETIKPDAWKDMEADAKAYGNAFAGRFGPSGKTPVLEAVEIGNEPGSYTDEQYTRMFRSLGAGLRAGDPKLKIASCNLTVGKSGKYDKSVSTIPLEFCDVLTIHTYAQLEGWPTWKRSHPEDPRLKYLSDVRNLAAWRDKNATGKPIWITEFGYDATTRKPDPRTEFAKWVGVTEEQQAQYLVRSTLLFANLPVERAYIYFFNDKDDPHVHGSSGITRNFEPKPAYYAMAHLQKTLGEFRFSRAVAEKSDDVYAYEFVHVGEKNRAIVVAWSPTGSGRSATVKLALGNRAIFHTERMPLAAHGVAETPAATPAAVPVTESPLYLFLK